MTSKTFANIRRHGAVFAAVLSLTGLAAIRAHAQNPPATPAAAPAAMEPADQPAVKLGKDGMPNPGFIKSHESFLARGKSGPIGVLFLGDSITAGWNNNDGTREVWKEHFGKYDPANFGIGGDRTQHVLWRIAQGELDGIHPKVLVLMIGTNNIGYPAQDILKGDLAIIHQIHEKLPDTKLLLLGIFPRGADPKDAKTAAMREKIKTVNAELAKLDDGSKTRYMDLTPKFLNDEGYITKEMMPDALHPKLMGYGIWANTMQPLLDEMMK